MAVTVEGDGGNATPMGHRVVDIPVIEGGIGRHMDRESAKGHNSALIERTVMADIDFIERQGVLS